MEIYRQRGEAEEKDPDPNIFTLLLRDSENRVKDPNTPDGVDPIAPPPLRMLDGLLEWTFEYDQVSWAIYQRAFFQILIEACCFGGKATAELARVTEAVANRGTSLLIPHGKFKVYHMGLFTILERNGPAKLTASDLQKYLISTALAPIAPLEGLTVRNPFAGSASSLETQGEKP